LGAGGLVRLAYYSKQESGRTRRLGDESGKLLQNNGEVSFIQLAFMNKRHWEGDYYGI
jgi:hypothetical protein